VGIAIWLLEVGVVAAAAVENAYEVPKQVASKLVGCGTLVS